MFKSICKALHHVRSCSGVGASSQTNNLHFLQIRPFSLSSFKPIQKSTNQHSFTVDYLITSFGFSPETALSASKYVKFEAPDKPDSVRAFFKSHGFTNTQISTLVRKNPELLSSDPEKTLLPKLEFLKSKGFSSTEVATMLSSNPFILQRSLENQIIPVYNSITNLLQSQVKAIAIIRRSVGLLTYDFQTYVEILKLVGVPDANIMHLFAFQSRACFWAPDKCRRIVEEVEKMGFNPLRVSFVIAVRVLGQMTKLTWDKKVEVYKKWGFSEDEILVTFRKHPWRMMASEDKIMGVMDFIVNKMGQEYTWVARNPVVLSLSLSKRIVPRCAVYQVLLSKGLVKANEMSLTTLLNRSENWFLENAVSRHKKEAPELLKLYKEKLDLASCLRYGHTGGVKESWKID